ncbi:MAG TPA: DUF167 domain-containing protein [Limnochordales bacterium]
MKQRAREPAQNVPWLAAAPGGVLLRVRVQPGASRTELAGPHGAELKVRVRERARNNRANQALQEFLGELLGVAPTAVQILKGQTARSKWVQVRGVSPADALRLLGVGVAGSPPSGGQRTGEEDVPHGTGGHLHRNRHALR